MVTNEQLTDFYREMLRIMLWEQGLLRLLDEGKVSGFYHAGRGQEAVAVGACAALRDDDYIMYDHRGCGHVIAKGLSLVKMYADFMGNVEGTTRGLGAGIVHIAWPELGILGQSGTLGGCFPIAAGAALSAKYRGTDQVCVCFFGDGTGNRGTFHESANAASVWKLPVIWLCENNGWAISTQFSEAMPIDDLTQRAAAYGIPGVQVDGNDVDAVYAAVSVAVARARTGQGPTFIEAKVTRHRGHFEGDPETYRTKEQVELERLQDPIVRLREKLLSDGVLTHSGVERLHAEVQAEIDDAATAALAGRRPGPERIYEGVYA